MVVIERIFLMICYKLVKKLKNGSRVSVFVPSWHPCSKVYQNHGINKVVDEGMVFTSKKL